MAIIKYPAQYNVRLSNTAEKSLQKIPKNLQIKFHLWIELVTVNGLNEARKVKSYHDEPLMGKRLGQRSIRLNKSYRVIYREDKATRNIEIIGVNKHEY